MRTIDLYGTYTAEEIEALEAQAQGVVTPESVTAGIVDLPWRLATTQREGVVWVRLVPRQPRVRSCSTR